jgi:hypothetical protein
MWGTWIMGCDTTFPHEYKGDSGSVALDSIIAYQRLESQRVVKSVYDWHIVLQSYLPES